MDPNYTNPETFPAQEEKSTGRVIAIIIIVVILLVGGFYLWKSGVMKKSAPGAAPTADTASEEVANIEVGLDAIDVSSDNELNLLEKQF